MWARAGAARGRPSVRLADGFREYLVLSGAGSRAHGGRVILTRLRFVGGVWRLAALVGLMAGSFVTFAFWMLLFDPGAAVGRPSWFAESAPAVLDAFSATTVDAGVGLYVLTVGCATGVLAALVPTFHHAARHIKDATKGGGTLAPGWYPSPHHRRRHRYWDGEKWTVGAEPVAAPALRRGRPRLASAGDRLPPRPVRDARRSGGRAARAPRRPPRARARRSLGGGARPRRRFVSRWVWGSSARSCCGGSCRVGASSTAGRCDDREEQPALHELVDAVAREVGAAAPTRVLVDTVAATWVHPTGYLGGAALVVGLPEWTALDPGERVAALAHELRCSQARRGTAGVLVRVAGDVLSGGAVGLAPVAPVTVDRKAYDQVLSTAGYFGPGDDLAGNMMGRQASAAVGGAGMQVVGCPGPRAPRRARPGLAADPAPRRVRGRPARRRAHRARAVRAGCSRRVGVPRGATAAHNAARTPGADVFLAIEAARPAGARRAAPPPRGRAPTAVDADHPPTRERVAALEAGDVPWATDGSSASTVTARRRRAVPDAGPRSETACATSW